ncbi:MAG: hypothetical protein IKP22_00430 [Clostridia bacterium]|nr:hypothetical protein [Clostridia bacterium]
MLRSFETSTLRRIIDLNGLWHLAAGSFSGPAYVPGCVECIPGLENHRGISVFERRILCRGNVIFSFSGVSRFARVLLDGKELGTHEGPYTGFSVVASSLSPGEHLIRVEADNRFGEESALSVPNDYMTYGGITRACMAEEVGNAFLSGLTLVPEERDGRWALRVRVRANSVRDPFEGSVRCEICGRVFPLGSVCVPAGSFADIDAAFAVPDAKAWSPEDPCLTSVRCVLSLDGADTDDLIERTGFRTVQVRGSKILLNGRPVRIRGFNRHEDHALFGCALPHAAMAADIQIIRSLGGNAVRTSHYPSDPYFLDLCDESGILVWEESHARGLNREQMLHPQFLAQSIQCVEEMILRDVSHPSIFIWGLLNECAADCMECVPLYSRLVSLIRTLDPTRPVTSATCRPAASVNLRSASPAPGFSDGDSTLHLYDVISFNCYPGWYLDIPSGEYLRNVRAWAQANGGQGKPFIVSEIGAGAIYGFRSAAKAKWSEERQADILREQLTAVMNDAEITGVFIWQLSDCRVSDEWFASRPRTMNNKGVTDEYRRMKLSCATVREVFMSHR